MSCIGEFRGWFFRYFSILANETWSFSRLRNIKWENTTSTVRVHCRTALHCLTNRTVANALQKGGWLIPRLHKVFLQQAGFSKVFRVCVGFGGDILKSKNDQIKVPLHQMGEGFSLGTATVSSSSSTAAGFQSPPVIFLPDLPLKARWGRSQWKRIFTSEVAYKG